MRAIFLLIFLLSMTNVRYSLCVSCGRSFASLATSRVIGGRAASRVEFPWMVSIQRMNNPILRSLGIESHRDGFTHFCGGSLIADSWVLTAAHCFDESLTLKEVRVIAGLHLLSMKTDEESVHQIEAIIKHPKWDHIEHVNDICLVKLKTPVKMKLPFTNTICLPRHSYTPRGYATIAGWGYTSVNGRNSDQLMSLDLPIIERKRCELIYGSKTIKEEMVCAGYLKGGKDSCNTDSGGPLMQLRGHQIVILGIISFGVGESCAAAGSITVNTRVSNYVPWIYKTINDFHKEIKNSDIRNENIFYKTYYSKPIY